MTELAAPLHHFDQARAAATARDRLSALRSATALFREEILECPPVPFYRSFDLVRVAYSLRYALRDACTAKTPFVHILSRMFIIQFKSPDGSLRTLITPQLDGDVRLGEGVCLIQTSGHTLGNHSIVVRTPEGPDAYAPRHSPNSGLRKHARDTSMEVVLNSNTLERALEQYLGKLSA